MLLWNFSRNSAIVKSMALLRFRAICMGDHEDFRFYWCTKMIAIIVWLVVLLRETVIDVEVHVLFVL